MALTAEERPRHRFTVEDVFEMLHVGILGEDDPVERIGGELVVMTPQGAAHAQLTVKLRRALNRAARTSAAPPCTPALPSPSTGWSTSPAAP